MKKNQIVMIHGTDFKQMTMELLEAIHLDQIIGERRKRVALKHSSYSYDACGMQLKLCSEVSKTDFMINMPVLKGHCQTRITCAMKNAKGVIPNSEKRRFHTLGLHKPIAHLNTVLPPQLVLVDNICGDLNFEEGGNPVVMNRIFACLDPVLCDAYVCECIGYSVDKVPYIPLAAQLGAGNADASSAKLVLLNEPSETLPDMHASGRIRKLEAYTDARDACSACYGSLVYALERLESRENLRRKREKIQIGQGWKGQTGNIGVGSCTHGCRKHLPGCPPKAVDIVGFLKEHWV